MEIYRQSLLTSKSRFIQTPLPACPHPPPPPRLAAFGHGWQLRKGGAAHSLEVFKQIMELRVKLGGGRLGGGNAESNKH